MQLNQRAADLVERLVDDAESLRLAVSQSACGARIVDLGINASGGLEAGRRLAEICMSGLGRVALVPSDPQLWQGAAVQVHTDAPLAACMASQYAGWRVTGEGFFAMGSGPMRAAAGKEELFAAIGHRERADLAVGVLESRQVPPDSVCRDLAEQAGVETTNLSLLLAPTASQAGTMQVVARTVETALHKLFGLGFDLARIESGYGIAPLPPVARDDMAAIGRTNDAVLYGGSVTLWLRGDDEELEQLGPKIPSEASPEHGEPFARIFERSGGDFYQIDPNLFSPATVRLVNLDTGRSHCFGRTVAEIVQRSFTT